MLYIVQHVNMKRTKFTYSKLTKYLFLITLAVSPLHKSAYIHSSPLAKYEINNDNSVSGESKAKANVFSAFDLLRSQSFLSFSMLGYKFVIFTLQYRLICQRPLPRMSKLIAILF